MKKLILLLLVVLGGVTQGQAEEYTVYFKPSPNWAQGNERYAFNTLDASNTDKQLWVNFSKLSGGIYAATYDTSIHTGRLIICRMNGATSENNWDNKWDQSGDLDTPNSSIFYDKSNNDWVNTWTGNTVNMSVKTPSDFNADSPSCIMASDSYIANNDESWATNSTVNKMTYNGDFTYSLTVNKNFAFEGEYKFKIYRSDVEWCGDPDNAGDHFTVALDKSGQYSIAYTYNILTGKAVATPTMTAEATMKYWVQYYDQTKDTPDFVNLGEMEIKDGNPTLAYSPLSLTTGENNIQYKISWEAWVGSEKVASNWSHSNNGVGGRYAFSSGLTGNHTITFIFYPKYFTSSVIATAIAEKYYYIGGSDNWAVNQDNELTGEDGVFSITLSNKPGHTFAIVPEYAFTSTSDVDWTKLIRPYTGNVTLSFANKNGDVKMGESNDHWEIPADYADFIVFTFNSKTNEWSAAPYFEKNLVAEAEGYATFSSKYDVAVPEGLKASYASAVTAGGGAIIWTEFESGVPAGQGALLEGTVGTYKFTPATEAVAPSTNYLKANLTQQKLQQTSTIDGTTYTHYVLYKNSTSGIGFYKVNSNGSWIAAGSAYLEVPNAANEAPAFFAIGGGEGTTGIRAINNGQLTIDNVYYDLSGRRVANPTKGIYIVNGKKVIVK